MLKIKRFPLRYIMHPIRGMPMLLNFFSLVERTQASKIIRVYSPLTVHWIIVLLRHLNSLEISEILTQGQL